MTFGKMNLSLIGGILLLIICGIRADAELTNSNFSCQIWLGNGNRYYDLTDLEKYIKSQSATPYYNIQGFKTERILFNFCSVLPIAEMTNPLDALSCNRFSSNSSYGYLIGHGNERTADGQLVPRCDALSGSPTNNNIKVEYKEYLDNQITKTQSKIMVEEC